VPKPTKYQRRNSDTRNDAKKAINKHHPEHSWAIKSAQNWFADGALRLAGDERESRGESQADFRGRFAAFMRGGKNSARYLKYWEKYIKFLEDGGAQQELGSLPPGETPSLNGSGDYATKRTVVPGKIIRVEWWSGKQWYVTHEARPDEVRLGD